MMAQPHRLLGCPCGCDARRDVVSDPACITHLPVPDRDGWCCSATGLDVAAKLAEAGRFCGPGRCARLQTRGTTA